MKKRERNGENNKKQLRVFYSWVSGANNGTLNANQHCKYFSWNLNTSDGDRMRMASVEFPYMIFVEVTCINKSISSPKYYLN